MQTFALALGSGNLAPGHDNMAKTTIKAGKRAAAAGRGGLRARKSGVAKTHNAKLRKLKPAKPGPRKGKPSQPSETASLKRQLKAARMQQQASAEILRAVANASGDVARPLQQIAETTARLFGAPSVSIQLAEGGEFTREYRVGAIAQRIGSAYPRSNIRVGGRNLPGTVVFENRQIHIPDLDHLNPSMSDFPGLPHARAGGARTVCGTPLRREDKAIGVLIVFRDRLLPFTDDELTLQQSFADQAVIAIENARLFDEVQAKTRDLEESLQQQTATGEVLQVTSNSPGELGPVFRAVLENATRICDAKFGTLLRFDGNAFYFATDVGTPAALAEYVRRPGPFQGLSGGMIDRILKTRQMQHTPDYAADPAPGLAAKLGGARSALGVPILKDDVLVGAIVIYRQEVRPFSNREIELVRSFAAQAAIAIENARLFNETREALAYQTGSSNVLRVIASSPTDVEPVLKAIVESAQELCEANDAVALLRDAEDLRFSAHSGPIAITLDKWPISRNWTAGRAFVDQKPVHVHDMLSEEGAEFPDARVMGQSTGSTIHTVLSVPLLRGNESIGAILLRRTEVRPFNDKQINLLSAFADQAVIAIQNARLFNETREALERQTATADILKVIASSPSDVQPVFEAIAERSNRLIGGRSTAVYSIDDGAMYLRAFTRTSSEADAALQASFPRPLSEAPWADRIRRGEIVEIPDAEIEWAGNPAFQEIVRLRGFRSQLFVPLRHDGTTIGIISVTRVEAGKFAAHHVQLLQTFADQAVIAIQNARLFEEVQAKTRDLAESLEHQTATSEVLQAIGGSMANSQPVFERILDSIHRLFDCRGSAIFLAPGDGLLHMAARRGDGNEALDRVYPRPIGETSAPVVIEQREQIYYPDVMNGANVPESLRRAGRAVDNFSVVLTPMLWDGQGVGFIGVSREPNVAFHEKELGLLRTFADQAVIAIENARLFNETREALERQTATGHILRIINHSPSDVTPVFDAIAERARVLCGALLGATTRFDGELLHLVGYHGVSPEAEAVMRSSFPRKPDLSSINGRCILAKAPVQIADIELDPQYLLVTAAKAADYRALLAVPMLQNGEVIGVIAVTRKEPGEFPGKLIELLQTFADQAVIAIQNADLFNEAQTRTRELSASLDELRAAQDRLVQTEKLASLGQLTAGIAHEIKNPLNFVNNFSALSAELIDELDETLAPAPLDQKMRGDVGELTQMLRSNLEKVVQHGKRADSIVKNMLLHSREGSGEQRPADINALLDESLNLAYHGARAEKPGFNITLQRDFDASAGEVELFPQEITRAFLNLISNGFYAASKRKAENGEPDFEPVLSTATKNLGNHVEIRIRDNGTGIPAEVKEKIFNPFFTTKPAGEGTGLGLSMSHDIIVKQHGGRIEVNTQPGQFTEFTIILPRTGNLASNRN